MIFQSPKEIQDFFFYIIRMNKNSKYIYTEKIIDPFGTAKPAQVGVDLTIAKIEVIEGSAIFDTDSKLDKNSIRYTEADS